MFMRLLWAGLALLGFLTLMGSATADDVTFTGEVTYRERIALPPGAELRVSLVALPDARIVASAAADVSAQGQVPLQFTLDVRSTVIADGRDYGLVAEIRSGGRTLFRNARPVPVDALAPAPTLIVVNLAPETPREPPEAAGPVETPNPLLDTTWQVTSIGGDPVLEGTEVTFSVAADLRAGGRGGCNSYFSEANLIDGPISFGPVVATEMACAPEVMAQEAKLFAALDAIAGYELTGERLQLVDAAGVPLVGLVRMP